MYIEAHSQYPKGRSNMSIHKWINKIWYIHTEENYSALERKKILTHAVSWGNSEDARIPFLPVLWGPSTHGKER